MRIKLEEITENAEQQIIRIARVSNPSNQDNPEYANLIRYCIKHQHWSVFEHAHLTLEIETSTAIATQILRHRSFTFQQFSQRYADGGSLGFEPIEWRKQAEKNRQSSGELVDPALAGEFDETWFSILEELQHFYDRLVASGVAKECARFIMPQCTTTRLYMTGNIRSWIHYIQLRSGEDVQKEHRDLARMAKKIFCQNLGVIALALGWMNERGVIV